MFHQARIVLFAALVLWAYAYADDGCGDNASIQQCGSLCAPTCNNPHPNPLTCPRIVCTSSTAGCRCNDGYVRNTDDGSCILEENCP